MVRPLILRVIVGDELSRRHQRQRLIFHAHLAAQISTFFGREGAGEQVAPHPAGRQDRHLAGGDVALQAAADRYGAGLHVGRYLGAVGDNHRAIHTDFPVKSAFNAQTAIAGKVAFEVNPRPEHAFHLVAVPIAVAREGGFVTVAEQGAGQAVTIRVAVAVGMTVSVAVPVAVTIPIAIGMAVAVSMAIPVAVFVAIAIFSRRSKGEHLWTLVGALPPDILAAFQVGKCNRLPAAVNVKFGTSVLGLFFESACLVDGGLLFEAEGLGRSPLRDGLRVRAAPHAAGNDDAVAARIGQRQ